MCKDLTKELKEGQERSPLKGQALQTTEGAVYRKKERSLVKLLQPFD
jgi:hypothetical protein